jgi:tRNA threonylcarbamoyladenosine biosynthesis protein TsaE
MTTVMTASAEETRAVGRVFAASLVPGDVVTLTGPLGSGKTHFVMGLCDGLGATGHVGSPTFGLVHEYPARLATVVHVDLYRLNSERELEELGFQEYLTDRYITCVEWPELLLPYLPSVHHRVRFAHGAGEEQREITLEPARP